MTKIMTDGIVLSIDANQLTTLKMADGEGARQMLASLWGADMVDLSHYQAIFYDSQLSELTEDDSFVTLSFMSHGYIADTNAPIAASEARKQIEIDLEIINREAQWSEEESKDYYNQVLNRTLNRLFLTRYGHLLLNYSLSEAAIKAARPLRYYQNKFDEIEKAMTIASGYRYQDIDTDNDKPSRSKLINLILSSEIF